MLRFVIHASHQRTLRPYLERWSGEVARRVAICSYDDLFRSVHAPACTHVFCDLERLDDVAAERAAHVWAAIRRQAPHVKLLNHPLRAMRRYELLRSMHEAGVNDFDVYSLTEARPPKRYPVFIRGRDDHAGPETGLLASREELDTAIESLLASGKSLGSRIAVEFRAEAQPDGLYRKYAAFFVDGDVLPRHLMRSQNWVVKLGSRVLSETQAEEERRYMQENPHREWIERVFALARIDYGRLDYAIVGGRPQVYEINTNPTVVEEEATALRPTAQQFCGALDRSLARLEGADAAATRPERIRLDPPLGSRASRTASALLGKIAGRQLRRSI